MSHSALDIVRAAIPGADHALAEHVLWGRTAHPFTQVSAKSLYKAASGMSRSQAHGIELCEFCSRPALPTRSLCSRCGTALHPGAPEGKNA